MGKLSKADSKKHDDAMALLSLSRKLRMDEKRFVYTYYNPMAEHSVSKNAVFFTPPGIAEEFAVGIAPNGYLIDLCAGIGALTWAILKHDDPSAAGREVLGPDIHRMVAVEFNSEFVEIGRKLLPQVEWYCNDVFDWEFLDSLGMFDAAISNPPYGNIPSASSQQTSWMKVKGPAEWKVVEIALRLAYNGLGAIMDYSHSDYCEKASRPPNPNLAGGYGRKQNWVRNSGAKEKYLEEHFPGVNIMHFSTDLSAFDPEDTDEYTWKGANPNVAVLDIDPSDVEWDRPFGFLDVKIKSGNQERKKRQNQIRKEAEQAQATMF